MSRKWGLALAAAVALAGLSGEAAAQDKSKRVAVAVMDFDYGTVGYHWWGQYDIGKGMADQVVDALVEDGSFRVIERKKLDTVLAEQDFAQSDRADPSAAKVSKLGKVLGVRYIIAGSITKFGGEEKSYGGGGLIGGKLGGLGLKKAKTEVSLTARMIDTTTGEIVASTKGEGLSKKGGGLKVGAGSWGGGGAFSMSSSDYKASAIGEAQEMATKDLVMKLVAKKDNLE
jgi:curli biogenesis system outer membrane secretion channel CsgG